MAKAKTLSEEISELETDMNAETEPENLPPVDLPPKPPRRRRSRRAKLEADLADLFAMVGGTVSVVEPYDGRLIGDRGPAMAKALADLAAENPRVAQVIEVLLTGGAWGQVMFVFGIQLVIPLTVHHGLWPETVNDRLAATFDIPVRMQHAAEKKADAEPTDEDAGVDSDSGTLESVPI